MYDIARSLKEDPPGASRESEVRRAVHRMSVQKRIWDREPNTPWDPRPTALDQMPRFPISDGLSLGRKRNVRQERR